MRYIRTVILIFSLGILSASSTKNGDPITFRAQSKYDSSSIVLKTNGTFLQYKRSCTYSFKAKGTWRTNGDTIILNQIKIKWTRGGGPYSDRAKKLVPISKDSLYYLWDKQFGLGNSNVLVRQ